MSAVNSAINTAINSAAINTRPAGRHLHFKQRDRLPAHEHAALNQPVTAAINSLTAGTGTAADQATLAAAFSVGYRVAESLPRHRHLLAEFRPSLDALTAIYERSEIATESATESAAEGAETAADTTESTTPWQATSAEIEDLTLAARIYAAVLLATSAKFVRRAITKVIQSA